MDALEAHGFVDCFAHVVDGEEGDRGGGECFHFDPGAGDCFGGGGGADGAGFESEVDGDFGERDLVAEGDEELSLLGGLDAGDAGDGEDVAFFEGVVLDEC